MKRSQNYVSSLQPAVSKTRNLGPDSPAGFCCTFLRRRNAILFPKMVWNQVKNTVGTVSHCSFCQLMSFHSFDLFLFYFLFSWYPVVLWSSPSCCLSEQHRGWSSICCSQSCVHAGWDSCWMSEHDIWFLKMKNGAIMPAFNFSLICVSCETENVQSGWNWCWI